MECSGVCSQTRPAWMMGRIKYKGSDSHNNSNSNNNNNSSNNNNNNNNNNSKTGKPNGVLLHSNGKHRNGGPLRRSRTHSSNKGRSRFQDSKTNSIFLIAIIVAVISIAIVFLNTDFLNSFFSELFQKRTDSNNSTSSGIESNGVGVVTSGGWRLESQDVLSKYDPGLCSIERISVTDLTLQKFESEIRFRKPVLITFPGGAGDWTDPEKWSRGNLIREYSKWSVMSGESLEIVRKGGNADHESSFVTFLNRLMDNSHFGSDNGEVKPLNYVFDRRFYWQTKLPKTLRLPPYFKVDRAVDDSIFFLGSSLTGVVFHKHSDTWNGVVYGRKRWFLYPSTRTPPGGVFHGYSLLDWVRTVYPNLTEAEKPMECVQEPGQILYLPEGTYHATLNMGDTIAVAIQRRDPQLETEILFYEANDLNIQIQESPPERPDDPRNQQLLDLYKELHRLLPENAEVMMLIGNVLYDMEQYRESLVWNQKAVQTEPYFILAYLHLGKTWAKLGHFEEAEEQFLKARARSPNFWDIYKEYGEFLYNLGRIDDALIIYKRGTELKPDLLPFWYFYKVCQEQVGDFDGAEATERVMAELRTQQG